MHALDMRQGCLAVGDDGRLERGVAHGLGRKLARNIRLDHDHARARIREIELQQIRRRQRVEENGHEACTDRTEDEGGIERRVVEQQHDALAALEPERGERVAAARGEPAEFVIGERAGRTAHGDAIPVAAIEIAEQDIARVVAIGHRKADLARAGTIVGNVIDDGRRHGVVPAFTIVIFASGMSICEGAAARRAATPGLQLVHEHRAAMLAARGIERGSQCRKHRGARESRPFGAESLRVAVGFVLLPDAVLGGEDIEVFDRKSLKLALFGKRRGKFSSAPPHGRDRHASQFAGVDQLGRHEIVERIVDRLEQRAIAERARVIDRHGQNDQSSAGAQLAAARGEELLPVVRRLPGVGRLHGRIAAIGDLDLIWNLRRHAAQPLHRPR